MARGRTHHHRSGGGGGLAFNPNFSMSAMMAQAPFYINGIISYGGPPAGFAAQYANLSPEDRANVKVMNLMIDGRPVKEPSLCCFLCPLIAGSICIFPLCLLCCDCYTQNVYGLFDTDISFYQLVAQVILDTPQLEALTFYVRDNYLNNEKCMLVENAILSKPKFFKFSFVNYCHGLDLEGLGYKDFQNYFARLKTNPRIVSTFTWHTKIYNSSTNPAAFEVNPNGMNSYAVNPIGINTTPNNPPGYQMTNLNPVMGQPYNESGMMNRYPPS